MYNLPILLIRFSYDVLVRLGSLTSLRHEGLEGRHLLCKITNFLFAQQSGDHERGESLKKQKVIRLCSRAYPPSYLPLINFLIYQPHAPCGVPEPCLATKPCVCNPVEDGVPAI
jgi:hypothetical protein